MAWEYKIIHFVVEADDEENYDAHLHNSVHYLNDLGGKGWEMVGFLPHHPAGQSKRHYAILKRPVEK